MLLTGWLQDQDFKFLNFIFGLEHNFRPQGGQLNQLYLHFLKLHDEFINPVKLSHRFLCGEDFSLLHMLIIEFR